MTSHLTTGQRALMEAALVTRQQQIETQIAQHLGGASRADHAREVLLQDGDEVAHDADREVDLARSDRDTAELRAVNDALARLKSGDYGRCIDCDAAIPFDRLHHNPQAARCVGCQAAVEAQSGPAHRPTL